MEETKNVITEEIANDFSDDKVSGSLYSCEIITVPRELIVTNNDNKECGYEVEDDITELALSIREYGLGDPLNVLPQADGTFFLAGGNRRIKALRYGDQQGWDWFKDGYPCVVSSSPTNKDNDIDRKIFIHELNIHNRDNSTNFYNLVQNLLELYRKKVEKESDGELSLSKCTKKVVEMLSEKLGVSVRQGYTLKYIAEDTADWLAEACAKGKITEKVAYQVGHMSAEIQEELHEYLVEHGTIPEDVFKEYAKRQFLNEDAPEWLKNAVENGVVSEELAYRIGFSTKDSKQNLQEYYEKNGTLPADVVSGFLIDKKGNTLSVQEILQIEQKEHNDKIIDSVTSGKVDLKNFKDPMDFDVEGISSFDNTLESPETKSYEGQESYGYNDETYPDDETETQNSTYGYPSYDSGNYASQKQNNSGQDDYNGYDNYDSYDNDNYGEETGYDSEDNWNNFDDYNDYDNNYEEGHEETSGSSSGFDNEYGDTFDTPVSEPKHGSTQGTAPAQPVKKENPNRVSTRDNEGSSGKSKELIMSDSTWWYNRMAQNEGMSETENIYVDMMFHLMNKFYFPSLTQRLEARNLPEEIKDTLKDLVAKVAPYLD